MTKWILFVILALSTLQVSAQQMSQEDKDREKKFQEKAGVQDTSKVYGWKHSLVAGANLTQSSFTNWVQGGQNSLSWTFLVNGNTTQNLEQTFWTNSLKLAFGQSRLGGGGLRKTDDEIYFESLFIYKLALTINPYASLTARTQFAPGYTYNDALGTSTQVSAFMDPGFFTESIGAAYTPAAGIRTRLGLAAREVVTSTFNQYAGGEKTKVWGGAESVTDADWNFAENMLLTSRLEIFLPFKPVSDVYTRFDNTLTAKVNQYVNVSLNVQLLYDPTVSGHMQTKEVLAIGVSYQFI